MNTSKMLLATVAVGAMIAAAPVEASAKAKSTSTQSSEIEMLKAQIEALKARLDAQDAANAQAQAAVQQSAAQAAAAQAAADQAAASVADVKKTADKAAKDSSSLAKLVDGVKDTTYGDTVLDPDHATATYRVIKITDDATFLGGAGTITILLTLDDSATVAQAASEA